MLDFAVTLALGLAASPLPAATDPVSQRAQPVIDRFSAAVARCGVRAPAKPGIELSKRDGIIYFDDERNTVVLYPWAVMGEDTHRTFARWAATDREKRDAATIYADIFNELLVAHELGHWVQTYDKAKFEGLRDKDGAFDRWRSEYNANQIMIAFWRENPPGREHKLDARMKAFFAGLDDTPNPLPPPAGTSERHFMNADTMRIVRAGAYGWYQGRMSRLAYAERPRPRFCALVAEWLPRRR